jgi:hypothetical protein
VEAIAQGLRRLLGDPGLRARLAGNAHAAAQAYSADHMVEAYSKCYGSAESQTR